MMSSRFPFYVAWSASIAAGLVGYNPVGPWAALAAMGILLGGEPLALLAYAGASLACWDQIDAGRGSRRLRSRRLLSLCLALAAAFGAILSGRSLSLELPFLAMAALALVAALSLDRLLQRLGRINSLPAKAGKRD